MAEAILMPKMSDTMTEGVIVNWLVKVGDKVKSDTVMAEVETDKATMEMMGYQDGVVLHIEAPAGQAVPIDSLIAIVGKAGEDIAPILAKYKNKGAAPAAAPVAAPVAVSAPAPVAAAPVAAAPVAAPALAGGDGRLKASPLAKAMAAEKGIDLRALQGSGEGGRIVKRDIESAPVGAPAVAAKAPVAAPGVAFEEVPVSQMRKTIARRLSESLFTAPHFYLTMSINMDKAAAFRKQLNEESDVKISFNDLVLKACALALRKHPKVNSSWLGDAIRYNKVINVGVAVAMEEGLLVPVIRNADNKGLADIGKETKDLAARAKARQLQPADWEGNTFTISNLGMYGIDEFTAIINPPDSCILAVGGIQQVPVVRNNEITIGQVMKVTLSCDHRVVDGATGSEFLQTVKMLLENPLKMLL
jgi:pyruvate dehydrogenase E2 component (dihydrolipoamide acetyltransferase)